MIRCAAPEWLLLAPALATLGWMVPRLLLAHPLRAGCAVLLVLLMAQPEIRRRSSGLDLWLLADRSASVADLLEPRLAEIEQILERSRRNDDRLFVVDFAESAALRGEGDPITPAQRQQSRLALALRYVLGRAATDRSSRILTLTDGASTEPVGPLLVRLREQGVAVDYRLFNAEAAGDFRLESLRAPQRVQRGEAFLLEIEATGLIDKDVPCFVLRDGRMIAESAISVRGGIGRLRLTDRLVAPGSHRYSVRLQAPDDPRPGNDWMERWVEVAGGPRMMLVTGYANDPLAAALRGQGFEIEVETELSRLHAGRLSGLRGLILNNVPAYHLPAEFLRALPFHVQQQGGALLMAGGKFSFGSGGYFDSPLDPLLPVSMELRTEHRKLQTAMAVVLDRSGSMTMTVPGGRTKMELADEGAARCVELLSPTDAVAVFAVDVAAHAVVPLTRLEGNQAQIVSMVRRIESAGGGICVPTGLAAAFAALQKSQAGQRHVVLFADANDATQELGDYPSLIAKMRAEGITISVIGLGQVSDSGGKFLEEVARLGDGRIFFTDDPAELPALFAQETVAVARSAFLTDPVALTPAPGWLEIAARPLAWPETIDGYNLSYARPGAAVAALSGDEYAAPLVATWHRGLGRAAAVSFPLGGEYSTRIRAWKGYGDFNRTLAAWLVGDAVPPGLSLTSQLDGTRLLLDLRYDESWATRLARTPPRIFLAENETISEPAWQRMSPGHFQANVELTPSQPVRGAVQIGSHSLPFGPVVAGGNVEWTVDPGRLTEFRRLAVESGGVERADLTDVWKSPRRPAFEPIQTWLLALLLPLALTEFLVQRTGWRLPGFPSRTARPVAQSSKSLPESSSAPAPSVRVLEPLNTTTPTTATTRQSRFDRAKRRK